MPIPPQGHFARHLLHSGLKWFAVYLGILLLLVGPLEPAFAQSGAPSNLRMRWLALEGDTLQLDSMSIVPGTLHVFADGMPVSPFFHDLDPYGARLIWRERPASDSVFVRYRVMPIAFGMVQRNKDPDRLVTASGDRVDPFRYEPPKQAEDLFGMQGLNKTGSISRGVLFGNNQDLAVNSTLNLELSGHLTDRIQVLASITDNNIPIQAGGNTLELQDFDQVFIKLFEGDERTGWSLIAGDFVLQRPKSHFLTYLKKTKGLSFETPVPYGGEVQGRVGTSVAISKGKFARNTIQGIEGVQGPYRLRGNEGGSIIIILSGTERVFIDGQPLVRGQENDYVIDYNTAEISFTARRLITKDRRIVVEFQYSDKNYARTLVRLDHSVELPRSTLRFNLYSEQDMKNQPLQQQLSDEERDVLREAGDNPLQAVVPGADSTGFAEDQVLYLSTDSLGYSPVYVYTTDPALALWRVTFTQVGSGNGDYEQTEFTPNGRVFAWVPPDTVGGVLVRNGDHAPVRVLVAPTSQQMLTFGFDHRPTARTNASVELAYSRQDLNTFSPLDDGNDDGLGITALLEHAIPLHARDSTLRLLVGGETEAITKDFRFVERYRAVEFDRNWNILGVPLTGDQLLAGAHVGLQGRKLGRVTYGFGTFQVADEYSGWKQEMISDVRTRRTDVIGTASWLTTANVRTTDFLRGKGQLKHRFRHFTVGYNDEQERNLFRTDTSDALIPGSYQFHEWEAFIQSPDSFRNKWRMGAGQRWDKALKDGALTESARATSYNIGFDLARNPRNRLNTTFTYRRLEISDSTLTTQRPEDTYLARIDYDVTLLKGLAVFDAFYEFGSGLEQRREYIYVQVPAGQGLYVWIDYNGNGVKELNEFELANFGYEANYLRVFVPSNDFVRSFSNQFSTALDIRPAALWADAQGVKRFIAKFSDMASFRVDRKTGNSDLAQALDPFSFDVTDTSLTSYSSSARNTFYYDRTSRKWSVDHSWQSDRSRSLLLNGFESRSRLFNAFKIRWNTTRQWTAEVELERGRVANSSDLLTGRTYGIDQQGIRPRLTWQPNTSFRTILSFKYTEKMNEPELGAEEAVTQDLGAEVRYNTAGKGSILLTLNRVDIAFDGESNSPLGNEMLLGLKPGTNMTWSLSIQRNLSSNLQVDITYNGRSSEGVPAVHVGGAQVRAFF